MKTFRQTDQKITSIALIKKSDLQENSGVCAMVNGIQVAIFYLPRESPPLYAIGNWDPLGQANVLSRGIVGDINAQLCVASPLYKHHFSLLSGKCLENPSVCVPVYPVRLAGSTVSIDTGVS
ncbi:MAG: nitrite reductase small subunit NirD [Pseudomonadales bacterium]|nr:nitrite reductase small subunit NirD [Pseudomonadales bacterium]